MYFSRETEQDDMLVVFFDHLVGMARPGDVLFGGKGDCSPMWPEFTRLTLSSLISLFCDSDYLCLFFRQAVPIFDCFVKTFPLNFSPT